MTEHFYIYIYKLNSHNTVMRTVIFLFFLLYLFDFDFYLEFNTAVYFY